MSRRAILDDFDRKLLTLFQENTRLTADELGERVGLSASACHRRLKRLRNAGVIEAEIAVIGIGVLGEYLGRIYDEVKQRPLYLTKPPRDASPQDD